MTKTLDISPQLLERARQLTQASSDEEAIILAVEAFAARGEAIDPADHENVFSPVAASPRSLRQADLIPLLGTFSDFELPEEEDHYKDLR
jgi:hypothetical protein